MAVLVEDLPGPFDSIVVLRSFSAHHLLATCPDLWEHWDVSVNHDRDVINVASANLQELVT